VRIVWEQSVYIGNAPVFCIICGQRSYPMRSRRNQLLLAVLYDQHGVAHGEVCRGCVTAGSEGIQLRLQERIQSLQAKAAELQQLADEGVQPPTLEEEFEIHQRDVS
jgi:hypothetical protein